MSLSHSPRPTTSASPPAPPGAPGAPGAPGRTAPVAPDVLARCREVVRPAMTAAIDRLHPLPREMAAFSLGWCDVGGTPSSGPGGSPGKGVRPALAVLCAEAAGAPAEQGVPGAVAVELIHTFSLLHDDIMDGDELRRQRATVWKAYGTGPAVLAGDALFALAMETLTTSANPHAPEALRRLTTAMSDLVRGQAEDLTFEDRPWTGPRAVLPGEYRTMAEHKTGALLGAAGALGAVLAGAPADTADALERAGRHLGIAFQAVDDLLGIRGDPRTTGKPVHSDLRQRKKTFPVLAALSSDGPAARQLAELLASDAPLDDRSVRRAAALIERADGCSAALAEARSHLTTARGLLRSVPLAPGPAEDVASLLPYLVDRTV